MTGCIYRLDFASGKSYVGLTSQPLASRVKGHRHDATRRASKLPVHNAWRVHGEPKVVTLMVVPKALLGMYETIAIKALGTMKPAGYNLSPGGEVSPSTLPGVAEKIAVAARARGISVGQRSKMVAGLREANKDPEVRARRSAARMGHVVTEEARAKARAAMSGALSHGRPQEKAERG